MASGQLFEILQIVTPLSSVLLQLSGLPICWNMLHTNSTVGVPLLQFTLGLVMSMGNYYYGLLVSNNIVVFVNTVGFVLQGVFLTSYLWASPAKVKPAAAAVVTALYYGGVRVLVAGGPRPGSPLDPQQALGLAGVVIMLLMCITPVRQIFKCIAKRNCEDFPMPMVYANLINHVCWLAYGQMLGDIYIAFPNIPGLMLDAAQISLYVIYGAGPSPSKRKQKKQ